LYSPGTFSLGDNLQARARNYRSGSQIHEKIINYDLVVEDSIEEKVAQAINNKEEIGKMVLEWAKITNCKNNLTSRLVLLRLA
jgi:hypothetical protein